MKKKMRKLASTCLFLRNAILFLLGHHTRHMNCPPIAMATGFGSGC